MCCFPPILGFEISIVNGLAAVVILASENFSFRPFLPEPSPLKDRTTRITWLRC